MAESTKHTKHLLRVQVGSDRSFSTFSLLQDRCKKVGLKSGTNQNLNDYTFSTLLRGLCGRANTTIATRSARVGSNPTFLHFGSQKGEKRVEYTRGYSTMILTLILQTIL